MDQNTFVKQDQREYRRQLEAVQEQQEAMEQHLRTLQERQRYLAETIERLRQQATYLMGEKQHLLTLSREKIHHSGPQQDPSQ